MLKLKHLDKALRYEARIEELKNREINGAIRQLENGMQDRELLELAAQAANLKVIGTDPDDGDLRLSGGAQWNPLNDDGDALRLVTALGMSVETYPLYSTPKHSVIVKQRRRSDQMRENNPTEVFEQYGNNSAAATRRAIVRAAAAVALANNTSSQP